MSVDFNFKSNEYENAITRTWINEIEMEYLVTGLDCEEILLFVHGFGADLSQFEGQHKYFKEKYRALSINLRGHESIIN